jgi:hypothetical protein
MSGGRGSDGDEGAQDQGKDTGECRAGHPLHPRDLPFDGLDFGPNRFDLGMNTGEFFLDAPKAPIMLGKRLRRSLRLVIRGACGPS